MIKTLLERLVMCRQSSFSVLYPPNTETCTFSMLFPLKTLLLPTSFLSLHTFSLTDKTDPAITMQVATPKLTEAVF